jgi:hypothetical protein
MANRERPRRSAKKSSSKNSSNGQTRVPYTHVGPGSLDPVRGTYRPKNLSVALSCLNAAEWLSRVGPDNMLEQEPEQAGSPPTPRALVVEIVGFRRPLQFRSFLVEMQGSEPTYKRECDLRTQTGGTRRSPGDELWPRLGVTRTGT